MIFSIDQYIYCQLTYEEVSVLAAFFDISALYGISMTWADSDYGNLRERIRHVVKGLEYKGLVLIEPGGCVSIDADLYHLFTEIKKADMIGRIACGTGHKKEVIYLYRSVNTIAFIKENQHGGCYVGAVPTKEAFSDILSETMLHDTGGEWMGLLLMKRSGAVYKTVFDTVWRGNSTESPVTVWNNLVKTIY